ncbi:MAG: TVP38/TMEM64 family protein [Halobacteriaceae archaeon]
MIPRVFASREQRRRFCLHLAVAAVALGLLVVVVAPRVPTLHDAESVRQVVTAFGPVGPLAFLALQVVQIVVVPIPGQVLGIAGGYLFGAALGFAVTMGGVVIGSFVAFWLARRYGRRYVTAVFAPDVVDRYDALVSKLGVGGVTVLVLFPGLPDDVVCFACGISGFSRRQFLAVVVLGRTPAYAVAVLSGAQIGDERLYRGVTLVLLLAVGSALSYLERDRIRRAVVARFGS